MTTGLIADDEPTLCEDLRTRLAIIWPELEIAGIARNGAEALAMAEHLRPDIAFLDIAMPVLTGLEVAERLSANCNVVFISAYDEYAISAFERGATDYVLKPFDNARLAQTVSRLRQRMLGPSPHGTLSTAVEAFRPRPHLRWIKAARGHDIDILPVDEIDYFEADSKYTVVYTAKREAIIRTPIKVLASELDPDFFWQIHRSTIVNAAHIESVVRGKTQFRVTMRGRPERLAVSDAYRHLFRHM